MRNILLKIFCYKYYLTYICTVKRNKRRFHRNKSIIMYKVILT
nr:MAG TPA: hypothetical protein [Caudoviricetes sp.]